MKILFLSRIFTTRNNLFLLLILGIGAHCFSWPAFPKNFYKNWLVLFYFRTLYLFIICFSNFHIYGSLASLVGFVHFVHLFRITTASAKSKAKTLYQSVVKRRRKQNFPTKMISWFSNPIVLEETNERTSSVHKKK